MNTVFWHNTLDMTRKKLKRPMMVRKPAKMAASRGDSHFTVNGSKCQNKPKAGLGHQMGEYARNISHF